MKAHDLGNGVWFLECDSQLLKWAPDFLQPAKDLSQFKADHLHLVVTALAPDIYAGYTRGLVISTEPRVA